jgi:hypothetical protein
MGVHCVGALLGMGDVYAKVLLDMGGVLGLPLLFDFCNSWVCHHRFTHVIVKPAVAISLLQLLGMLS